MTLKQIVGKRNQLNGRRYEINVWNKINHGCCLARVISSGSKGLFDVWGLQHEKLRVISFKRNGYFTPKERRDYAEFMRNKPDWCQVEVWWHISPKRDKKKIMKTAEQFLNWNHE